MQDLSRRAALGILVGGAVSTAFPAGAASNRHVTLQVVGVRRNQELIDWLGKANRRQRVLDFGPKVIDGMATGRYQPLTRKIPMSVFFWMKEGFGQSSAVRDNVTNLVEERASFFQKTGSRLKVNMTEVRGQWQREFDSLPFATEGAPSGVPNLAIKTSLDGYALGWQLNRGFLKQVNAIMICPRQNTVWPRRTGGRREGVIFTVEEIQRWLKRGFVTPTAGMVDSV